MSLPSTFRKLWAAQTVSAFGARITREGLPIMAVTTLGASAATLGVLAAVASGAALAAALATGGLIDRHRRRPLLIGADLLRAAVLITIPISAGLGVLTLPQVLAAAALVAAASVVFDIASHSYLPSIIGKAELVEGNSRLAATESVAEVGGPALAGLLFQWLSAPIAVAANAVTYLVSAGFLATIRNPEAAPAESPPDHWTRDVTQGFRLAWSDPHMRPLLLMTAAQGLFGGVFSALYVLFAVRTLGLTPAMLGLAIGAGGVGALAGAVIAPRLSHRLGQGRAIIVAIAGAALAVLITPFAPAAPVAGLAALIVSQVIGDAFAVAGGVLTASLRQTLLPQAVLGRVAGAFHASAGAMSVIGALGGGLLGQAIGPRAALLIAALGFLIPALIAVLSPLRDLRENAPAD
ncbi:MFS transporter [Phenylobacterium sp.]|uniref:MFS transporter n=1 Tax=Phenylobacterium sp. TaxID=1871053 RepID=UPI002731163D|nr:MFS transporter [Phenylobacterium sp.]MDP1599321.1 MFS transporter [Phenylobacterium sp.]MDP3591550.1 MFS transporter [Phenylobacterium sp.]